MNKFTQAYIVGLHRGLRKKAESDFDSHLDSSLKALKAYQPLSDQNIANTGRWLGGVSLGIPAALIGGASGTIKGLSEDPYNEKGERVKPNWFVRGLKGGAKGTALGAGIGAGIGVLGGHFEVPRVMREIGKKFVETPPSNFSGGNAMSSRSTRAGALEVLKSLSFDDLNKLESASGARTLKDKLLWLVQNPDQVGKFSRAALRGGWEKTKQDPTNLVPDSVKDKLRKALKTLEARPSTYWPKQK